MRNKLLLIEDDLALAIPLGDYFWDHGLEVFHASTAREGLALYRGKSPDILVLDVVLPDGDGFGVMERIRQTDRSIPVILMTGTEYSQDRQIQGYQSGAINFMQKPVIPQAMLSLVRHILSLPDDLKQYNVGGTVIRIHSQLVEIAGEKHNVREKDARLLNILLAGKNQVVPRATLLKQVWLDDHPDKNNLLDGAVLRIRNLLKKYPHIHIHTIYGGGYMLDAKTP